MSVITLVFPFAAILFIVLLGSEYVCALRRGVGDAPRERRLRRADALIIIIICIAYGVTAFTALGSHSVPESFCHFTERGVYALIEFKNPKPLAAVRAYSGLGTGYYRIETSADGESWSDLPRLEQSYSELFKWRGLKLSGESDTRYLRITADSELYLGEIAFYDANDARIPVRELIFDPACDPLFDEQDIIPAEPGYMNSMYFDEIYHARTAYENLERVYPYEISHPPLGKVIISAGIAIFGMNPFGWRFSGALFGVLMLPLMYLLLKRVCGGLLIPACCTAVFAFDFMHYVQTRIATIDTYGVFFTLCMYLCMFIYLETGLRARRRRWRAPLALAGVAFGLGAAAKWTCVYAGAGLAALWLADRVLRALTLRRLSRENGSPWENCQSWVGVYVRETAGNVLWCLVFFVIVPCAVYYISYVPYGLARGMGGNMLFRRDYLDMVLQNQKYMLNYHVGVHSEHPYSSRWYEWILDLRPILYVLDYLEDGRKSTFGAFMNPLVCWGGLAAIAANAHLALARRDKRAAFIVLGYLAQLVPWMFITRTTFAYHYFPCLIFLVLAIAHCFELCLAQGRRARWTVVSFTAVCLVMFAAFYPILTGTPVTHMYSGAFLKWLPSWPF